MTELGVYVLFGTLIVVTLWALLTSGSGRHAAPARPCTGCVYTSTGRGLRVADMSAKLKA